MGALLAILEELQVPPEEFFSPNYRTYQIDESLREQFSGLTDRQRAAVDALFKSFREK